MDEQRTANQEPDPERPGERSVDGLGCMGVRTHDIDRLQGFYSGLLGARVATRLRLSSGPRLCVLDIGSETALHLFEEQPRRPRRRATDCGHHFGFRVTDEEELDGFVSRLHRLGLRSARVVDAGPWWRVEFDDPDGNRVSAACFKPSLSLTRLAGDRIPPTPVRAPAGQQAPDHGFRPARGRLIRQRLEDLGTLEPDVGLRTSPLAKKDGEVNK